MSVLIPTYTRAELLPRARASVLAQTFTDFEVIVVVDGSTDETADVLRRVEDPRVHWIVQPNAGISAARNAGIELAAGEWLAFLDDDNEWFPAYLERQLATAARTNAPVVYAQGVDVGDTVPRIQPDALPEGDVFSWMTRRWHPFITAVMVRRDLAIRVGGFSTALPAMEDTDLLLRLGLRVPFGATPAPLITRHRPGGLRLSENFGAARDASVVLDRSFGPVIRANLGAFAYAYWFRWNRGESEIRLMHARAPDNNRRAAWAALRSLAPLLPWSTTSIWRPVLLLVIGPGTYERARLLYHDLHQPFTHRR